MERNDYPTLKPPSEDAHGGAITFEMLQKAFSPESLERERLQRKWREEEALRIRKDVYGKCLALCDGDKEKATEMYMRIEMRAFERHVASGLAPQEFYE